MHVEDYLGLVPGEQTFIHIESRELVPNWRIMCIVYIVSVAC